jgi:plastocyanin
VQSKMYPIMASVGKVALIVIFVLGVVTGIIFYYLAAISTPKPGIVDSLYRKELPPVSEAQANKPGAASPVIDESKFTNKVAITILKGASIQGNPSYGPDTLKASANALITWTNVDTTIHTATSGTGAQDPDSGKLFDSNFLNPNQKYSIPASKIGPGDHPFYCKIHPYMTGKIMIG